MSVEKKQRKRQAEEGQPKAAKPLKKAKKDVVNTPENSDDNASTPAALAKQSPAKSAAVMDAAAFRKAHDITLQHLGTTAAEVYQSFDDAPFPKGIQQALKTSGFTVPTPIQAQAWPLALTGRDILATAKTGSGKTCGYLLPAMTRVLKDAPELAAAQRPARGQPGNPAIIVMAPTRELAMQIQEQAAVFGRAAGLRSVAVYGGAPKGPQIRELHSGAQMVIATPGRLNDLMEFHCQDGSSVLTLSSTRVLVLDEADRMCDMGFEDAIKTIVAQMPATKQTLFFTATWPKAVARVASSILRNPVHVSIGSCDELRANKDIVQHVQVVDSKEKYDKVLAIVKAEVTETSRTIIFCNKKYMCDRVESDLWEAGYAISAIHGDKSQQDREWALSQIRAGKLPLLVATDVAARGLDIKGMDRVINMDFPNSVEDYVHRIGRTGRAGASGVAHTLFTREDAKHAGELVKIMREAGQEVPSALEALVSRGRGGPGGNAGGKWSGNKWGGNKWGRNGTSGGGGGGQKSWGKKW